MKCEEVADRLLELLYEELSPDESRRVEGHLEGCPGCRRKLEGYRRAQGFARALPELSPPPARFAALLAEAQAAVAAPVLAPVATPIKVPVEAPVAKGPSFWERLRFLFSPPALAAASVALVVGASFVLFNNETAPSATKAAEAPSAPALAANDPVAASPAPRGGQEGDVLQNQVAASLPALPAEPSPKLSEEKLALLDVETAPKPQEPTILPSVPVRLEPVPEEANDKDSALDSVLGGGGKSAPMAIAPAPTVAPSTPAAAPGNASAGEVANTSDSRYYQTGTITVYEEAYNRGRSAYQEGRFQEANSAYQEAEQATAPGTGDWNNAILGQTLSFAATRDCSSAESEARGIPTNTSAYAAAQNAVGECFLSNNDPERARAAYALAAQVPGTEGAAAQRALTALEVKLSKPSLDSNAEPASPKKAAKKTAPRSESKSKK
jgi:anti-sigma factor RsiW